MSFIGIITNQKNESYIEKELSKYIPIDNIVFIKEKNIQNVKNVRFETILIDKEIKFSNNFKNILSSSKYIILNSDLNINLSILKDIKLSVITYGFNNKATFSVSSVDEKRIIICLQRIIKNILNEKIEPQEYEVDITKDVDINTVMGTNSIEVIYGKK